MDAVTNNICMREKIYIPREQKNAIIFMKHYITVKNRATMFVPDAKSLNCSALLYLVNFYQLPLLLLLLLSKK